MRKSLRNTCFFRHALALDERRAKPLPIQVDVGESDILSLPVKEVWFAGSHFDM